MDIIAVYTVKTDIVKEDKTKLQVNVIGENLVDAINSASYLKYNDEKLEKHIVGAEKILDKVYRYTFNNDSDLNPNYKPKEDKNNENT